jgi:zinc transport system ATP-binding protein
LSESSLRYLSGIWIIASVRGETQKRQHVRPASVYQHLILNGLAVAADEWLYETHEWKARLSMPLLVVRNLTVQIEKQSIIQGLTFDLEPAQILSILGPNGAGKTVLLKALLNLIPYSGEIIWQQGVRLGYVPQKIDADRHLPLTYKDLFVSKCRIVKVPIAEIDPIARYVGLTDEMLKTPVGHLSGGQFQRGLIGFALIGKPNVLLLDEPTSSLDEPGEERIYELIHRLQDQYQLAVITVSHDLSFVYRHATKVLCLNRRRLCMGTPQEALTPEVLGQLYGPSYSYYRHDHVGGVGDSK